MLIKIKNGTWLEANDVKLVKQVEDNTLVITKDGGKHWVNDTNSDDMGKTIQDAQDDYEAEKP